MGLVVRILGFHYCGLDSIPVQGTKSPQDTRRSQKNHKILEK